MSALIPGSTIKHTLLRFAQATIGTCMLLFPFFNNFFRYRRTSLRIGYYHIISGKSKEYLFEKKKISPDVFEKQLSFFQKRFDIISLTDALQRAEKGESFYRKLVLTFDDGFVENYTVAAPILKEKKIPATFFLIGDCIDNKDLMWRNKLLVIRRRAGARLPTLLAKATQKFDLPLMHGNEDILKWSLRAWPMNRKEEIANFCWNAADIGTIQEYLEERKPYLSIEQIHYLINDGFEIGSHSMTHPVFSRLSFDEFEKEILTSVQLLESTFERTITSFAYPFGIKASLQFEQKLLTTPGQSLKTLLGSRNKLNNYLTCLHWERDNFEFPMNEMLFRLNVMPLLRRLGQASAPQL